MMHLSPDAESFLPDILSRVASVPIELAADGVALERNRVCIVPPGTVASVSGQCIRLRAAQREPRERNPIDVLFVSLAHDLGERAVGVVLSGTGSDGSAGVMAIKKCGGLTVAQGANDSIPQFGDMPENAIATGSVDWVVPVEEMPDRLVQYHRTLLALVEQPPEAVVETGQDESRQRICAILRRQLGHDFSGYKSQTFLRRVQRRMQVTQCATLPRYVDYLENHADEAVELFRDLLIGVTHFFRDPESFDTLCELAIKPLLRDRDVSDDLRIWVPACASGEEAYSIAMLVHEQIDTMPAPPRVRIFATDIDAQALDTARRGRYPAALLENLSPQRLSRFFVEDGAEYAVRRELRDLCVFSPHSLVRDPPFSRIDLISCRNVLIYFGARLQSRVIPVFHYALRPGGLLFLGIAENLSHHPDLFAPVDRKHRLFRRREGAPAIGSFSKFLDRRDAGADRSAASGSRTTAARRRAIEARILETFAPAHVVVNAAGDIVHYSSRTGKYLEPAAGRPTLHLLATARRGLQLPLRDALEEAARTSRRAERERIPVSVDGGTQLVTVTVEPLEDGDGERQYLVLFSDVGESRVKSAADADGAGDQAAAGVVETLERDLRETKERLQSAVEEGETTIEELKSANEEMLSVNEELQSSNEELETAKEEMQSLNEELHAMNLELTRSVEELDQANSDLRNVFDSTQVAMIFLDQSLVIRSYTRPVVDLFNLISSDRGRPLTDISHQLIYDGLSADLSAVLGGARPIERHVRHRTTGAYYLLRILPYRSEQKAIAGLLLVLVDITALKTSEEQQHRLVGELNHRVRNMLSMVTSLAVQTFGTRIKEPVFQTFLNRVQAVARTYQLVTEAQWRSLPLRSLIEVELEAHSPGPGRVQISGPDVVLTPRAALSLGMVVHELATNAVKYGAFSSPTGTVEISWSLVEASADRNLEVRWVEQGSAAGGAKHVGGFGTRLIEEQMRYELGGTAVRSFAPSGFSATFIIPARHLASVEGTAVTT